MLRTMARDLNPFQNPSLAHKCVMGGTSEVHLKQKLEELIDLDDGNIREVLTPEECVRIAGGFGATDESVANLLQEAMQKDVALEEKNGVAGFSDVGSGVVGCGGTAAGTGEGNSGTDIICWTL